MIFYLFSFLVLFFIYFFSLSGLYVTKPMTAASRALPMALKEALPAWEVTVAIHLRKAAIGVSQVVTRPGLEVVEVSTSVA